MDVISFLLICAILLFPVLFMILFAKAMQTPIRKPRHRATGPEYRHMLINDISRISITFPTNTNNEQETIKQSNKPSNHINKTMTATYLNNLLDLKKFLNKFTDEELQSQDCFVLNYRVEDRDYPGTYRLEDKDIQYVAINQWNIEFYENKEALNV